MKFATLCGLFLTIICCFPAIGQLQIASPKGDISLKFLGRTSIDLGSYLNTEGSANRNGLVVNDTRLGVLASIDTVWSVKMEICFTNKAISFRDLYIQRSFNKGVRSITLGNVFIPIGLKPAGTAYKFIEASIPDNAFTFSRKLGISYAYTTTLLNYSIGFYSDGNVDAKALNQGYSAAGQVLVRPIHETDHIAHVALSTIFTHPSGSIGFNGILPGTITSQKLISVPEMEAYNYGRLELQALYILRRFYAEAHFQKLWVNRPNEIEEVRNNGDKTIVMQPNYHAAGFYVQGMWRIFGQNQKYNFKTGLASNATARSLEVGARLSYTDFSTYGDILCVTIGANYYFNSFLRARINYINASPNDEKAVHYVQGRLQFSL